MSVVWIKVNRENKTHSIYCDGRITKTNGEIVEENKCKFAQVNIDGKNVLIGATGYTIHCDYIKNHIYEAFNDKTIQEVKEKYYPLFDFGRQINSIDDLLSLTEDKNYIGYVEEFLKHIFYKIFDKKIKNHKEDCLPYIILSINGYLFKAESYNVKEFTEENEDYYELFFRYKQSNHIECGSGSPQIQAILEYDINTDPQKALNVVSSIDNCVNNHLFKLENILFENEEKEIN